MTSERNAIVLLSGGLDSATVLALAAQEGYHLHAMTFRYGQRHQGEVQAARRIAAAAGVKAHQVVEFDLRTFGGSALTADVEVPKDRRPHEFTRGVPITYVPARNTIFLSFALAWAEVLPADHIFIGVNVLDYSGYPDCRPEFIEAFERMARLGTKAGAADGRHIRVHMPLVRMSKSQIIRAGVGLGVDYGLTTSCYDPATDGRACGRCDACIIRRQGFRDAGVPDPTPYATA